jgi:hypothetical protein
MESPNSGLEQPSESAGSIQVIRSPYIYGLKNEILNPALVRACSPYRTLLNLNGYGLQARTSEMSFAKMLLTGFTYLGIAFFQKDCGTLPGHGKYRSVSAFTRFTR